MSGASQQLSPATAAAGGVSAGGGGIMGMLAPLVDQNRDGSIVEDLLGQAGKLFGGR